MLQPADIFPRERNREAPLYYDPACHLVANPIDNGVFHSAWMSAEYAVALIESGAPEEIARAELVIAALLGCQDTDPRSPHCGNFKWEHEDAAVEDLNAVQFALIRLIPLLLEYADALSPDLVARAKEGVLLGLGAIRRIDVSPIYSNIVAQDIANSILGGQLLARSEYTRRGIAKLRRWLRLIDESGIPHEYNSPTYAFVCIEALHKVVKLSHAAEAQTLANLIITRIGLSLALHLHPRTGRLAPPHCRAYYPDLVCATQPEAAAFLDMIAQGKLPGWLGKVLRNRALPMTVSETSDARAGTVISSTLDAEYSLGVASQELATQSNRFISGQSNVCALHYQVAGREQPGVVFSRYVINDKWLGDYRSTPSRTNDHIFRDAGSFRGVLAGSRAIGLYTSRELDAWSRCHSAKAALIWSRSSDVDEIWINDRRVSDLPVDMPEGAVIVVGCGNVYVVAQPLERRKLGAHAPIRLVEHRGCLVLEMYNYLGPAKTFWELAKPGAFFQGYVHNGFVLEVMRRGEFKSGRDVAEIVSSGQIRQDVEEPRTFDGATQRRWQVSASRGDQELGIEVDLMRWETLRRWANGAELGLPMLSSPIARQDRSGCIELGGARLQAGKGAAWLLAMPEADLWAAAYHGPGDAPLSLDLPDGNLRITSIRAGMIVWEAGELTIEALDMPAEPVATGAKTMQVIRSDRR